MQNVSGTGNIFTNYHLFVLHAEICDISFLSMWAPVANLYSSPPPQSSLTLHQTPWHLRLQPPHRTVFLKYFPFLQNTTSQNQPKQKNTISHGNRKINWGKNRDEKVIFFLSKFWISRRERESVCKISFIREEKEKFSSKSHSFEKRNFLQNHEFWEENKSFIFEILTIKNIEKFLFSSSR